MFAQREIDPRRPPKERVLGIPPRITEGGGGIAFPFGELNTFGNVGVAHGTVGGGAATPVVVFWDGVRQGAIAFYSNAGTQELTFETRQDTIVDLETGSTWTIEGLAVDGPLVGTQLEAIAEAHVAFWFAWATFHPDTELWEAR